MGLSTIIGSKKNPVFFQYFTKFSKITVDRLQGRKCELWHSSLDFLVILAFLSWFRHFQTSVSGLQSAGCLKNVCFSWFFHAQTLRVRHQEGRHGGMRVRRGGVPDVRKIMFWENSKFWKIPIFEMFDSKNQNNTDLGYRMFRPADQSYLQTALFPSSDGVVGSTAA